MTLYYCCGHPFCFLCSTVTGFPTAVDVPAVDGISAVTAIPAVAREDFAIAVSTVSRLMYGPCVQKLGQNLNK
jgi:hypothetical protein